MSHSDFIHLRVRSAYSLSEGAITIPALIELCAADQMPAVAVTDRGNLFGALEFSLAASKGGVQPIIGCDLALMDEGEEKPGRERPVDWLALLVQNETGYRNLLTLTSKAFLETESGDPPHIGIADLSAHGEGLLALSGGTAGIIGRHLSTGNDVAASQAARQLAGIFPGRFYIELMRHDLAEENAIEARTIDLAYSLDLPLVATNDVHFATADMFEAHDALLCIADGEHVDNPNRRRLTPTHCFRTAEEMHALFADVPEAVANTMVIAERCAYMAPSRAPILPAFSVEDGRTEPEVLREQALAGLEQRLATEVYSPGMGEAEKSAAAKPYFERLDYELGVIIDMQFPGYFLIVADFIKWAKQHGIPVGPGRGSGAGSVVAWALTITDLDPLRYGLLFERFLNPERISMPDFDIDFCQDRRDEVIEYVCDKYGHDRVAQIITFGKLQARAALRDVGRVLGMPYGQVDRISKLVPYNPANPPTLQEAIDGEPRFQEMRDEDPTVEKLIGIALRLEGLFRHASTHAAGVVIADRPLRDLVPLYRDPRSEMPVTQFSMSYAEKAGLVKFDFLGLKTLTVLERACDLLHARGVELDLAHLPLDDRKTFDMLGTGASMGVFQLEGTGMRDVLRGMKPDSLEEIIALVALYRPGPMDNIPRYVACKHGQEEPDYLHPMLEDILKETFGVIIYQEQVMQIAQVLAGYSLGEADLLRRAMGKKIKSEMEAQRETFVAGALANGVTKADASRIFELVAKFAGYGFNKSHAAAYGLVAYQTAYLKANFPVEFFAASMSLDLNNTEKLASFRNELDRLDIELLPPDINRSFADFAVEELEDGAGAVRYALGAIKNVGHQAMRALVEERANAGPFEDLFEFAARLDHHQVNKRQLENLARAGAFDCLTPNRCRVFEAVEMLLHHAASTSRDTEQISLFDGAGADVVPLPKLPDRPDWRPMDRLMNELGAIGFYLSSHPLDDYGDVLEGLNVTPSAELPALVGKGTTRVRLAGVVLSLRERGGGERRFAFVQLSDPSGGYELAVFNDVYPSVKDKLEVGKTLLVTAQARFDEDQIKLTAQMVDDLESRVTGRMAGLAIHVRDSGPLEALKQLLEREGAGPGRIALVVDKAPDLAVDISLPAGYALSPGLRSEISALPGVVEVREMAPQRA